MLPIPNCVVSVRVMCSMLILDFDVIALSGSRACFLFVFFSNLLLFRIMWIRYLITICEKDSTSLRILELGICRSWRSLKIVVCTIPLKPAVIMSGSTFHRICCHLHRIFCMGNEWTYILISM